MRSTVENDVLAACNRMGLECTVRVRRGVLSDRLTFTVSGAPELVLAFAPIFKETVRHLPPWGG